jgi:hypothetical protein
MSLRRVNVAVALALLACLAGGFLDEYVHTHDGSAFETRCFVCQRHAGSVAVVALPLTTPVVLEAVGNPPAPPSGPVLPAPIRHEAPRGPPQV